MVSNVYIYVCMLLSLSLSVLIIYNHLNRTKVIMEKFEKHNPEDYDTSCCTLENKGELAVFQSIKKEKEVCYWNGHLFCADHVCLLIETNKFTYRMFTN